MNFHMYRDEVNHNDNPTFIEHELSIFEDEIAKIFNNKLLFSDEITIDRRELEKIRIFLGLLSFRCDYRAEQYKNGNFTDSTKQLLSKYVIDNNYEDLWKREIEEISKMRTFDEIDKSTVIDPIIKMDFDQLIKGYYMTIVDARGGEFLITDVYPTLEICPLANGTNIHLHYFYPISPTRMIILNNILFRKEGIDRVNSDPILGPIKKVSQIRGNLLKQPKHIKSPNGIFSKDDKYYYKPQKIYGNDLIYINSLLLNEARIGILYKNGDKIISSVKSFNEEEQAKKKFYDFEKKLSI